MSVTAQEVFEGTAGRAVHVREDDWPSVAVWLLYPNGSTSELRLWIEQGNRRYAAMVGVLDEAISASCVAAGLPVTYACRVLAAAVLPEEVDTVARGRLVGRQLARQFVAGRWMPPLLGIDAEQWRAQVFTIASVELASGRPA